LARFARVTDGIGMVDGYVVDRNPFCLACGAHLGMDYGAFPWWIRCSRCRMHNWRRGPGYAQDVGRRGPRD
jgi:hypothetical protein